jgi:hypothetical protein
VVAVAVVLMEEIEVMVVPEGGMVDVGVITPRVAFPSG